MIHLYLQPAAWSSSEQLTIHHPVYIKNANPAVLCPDLLRYEQLGEADTWRGRVVRGFFWLLRRWPA